MVATSKKKVPETAIEKTELMQVAVGALYECRKNNSTAFLFLDSCFEQLYLRDLGYVW